MSTGVNGVATINEFKAISGLLLRPSQTALANSTKLIIRNDDFATKYWATYTGTYTVTQGIKYSDLVLISTPTPTPTPTATPTPTPTPTATPTPTPTPTLTPTPSPTPTRTPTPTPTPTVTPVPISPATINWSLSEASGDGYFIDGNLQISYTDTSGNAQSFQTTTGGSGTLTVKGNTSVVAQAYCFTATPPTYWGSATAASIKIVADGTTVDTPLTVGSDSGTQTATHTFTATAGSTKSVAGSSTYTGGTPPTGEPINITGLANTSPSAACGGGAIVYVSAAQKAAYEDGFNYNFASIAGATLYTDATLSTQVNYEYAADGSTHVYSLSGGTLSGNTGFTC